MGNLAQTFVKDQVLRRGGFSPWGRLDAVDGRLKSLETVVTRDIRQFRGLMYVPRGTEQPKHMVTPDTRGIMEEWSCTIEDARIPDSHHYVINREVDWDDATAGYVGTPCFPECAAPDTEYMGCAFEACLDYDALARICLFCNPDWVDPGAGLGLMSAVGGFAQRLVKRGEPLAARTGVLGALAVVLLPGVAFGAIPAAAVWGFLGVFAGVCVAMVTAPSAKAAPVGVMSTSVSPICVPVTATCDLPIVTADRWVQICVNQAGGGQICGAVPFRPCNDAECSTSGMVITLAGPPCP